MPDAVSMLAKQVTTHAPPSPSLPTIIRSSLNSEQWTDSKDNKVQKETEAYDLDLKSPG